MADLCVRLEEGVSRQVRCAVRAYRRVRNLAQQEPTTAMLVALMLMITGALWFIIFKIFVESMQFDEVLRQLKEGERNGTGVDMRELQERRDFLIISAMLMQD